MPHNRRYSSSDRDSRSSYQDRYRDRGRRHRHRRTPSYSSSSDKDRDRRGRGHRQEGSYVRSRRYVCYIYLYSEIWVTALQIFFMFGWLSLFRVQCVLLSSHSVVAMTIAQRSTGHLTEDTARVTDAWIRAETTTEKGSHMEQLKVTIHVTLLQTCMTTDAAVKGNVRGTNRTGEKAAGVSTNEGGVEPGPIAHPPRWVQPDLNCVFTLLILPLQSVSFTLLRLSLFS